MLDRIKVRNMTNSKGNKVYNQVVIDTPDGTYFQSYHIVIAYIPYGVGNTVLDPNWDYSRTTNRYRNLFLGEGKKETERKIKEGTYVVKNLN